MKLKVCGMKLNTAKVAQLRPDYLGFIFWEPSSRFFNGEIPPIPHEIKKIGVFVNADIHEILEKVEKYHLQGVQLHGKENQNFCEELISNLKKGNVKCDIIKVFSIIDDFDFSLLKSFENVCDYYLFDTKGKLPGGNGYAFDWKLLNDYPSTKPYFLSGGIGLNDINKIKEFMKLPESKYCYAIDVNSKFELEPGLKKIKELQQFKKAL